MNATYAYDLVGNLIRETHGNGQAITHDYDRLNRRTLSNDGIGNITRLSYDANGNVLTSDDANGRTSTYIYNALNQTRIFRATPFLACDTLAPDLSEAIKCANKVFGSGLG